LRLQHDELRTIAASPLASRALDLITVARDRTGLMYVDGQYRETLTSGMHAFWKGLSEVKVVEVDLREAIVDITGQDLMTADKVTLRINATVTWRVTDARRAVTFTEDLRQTLYREAQLLLRSIIGARELDVFLSEKGAVSRELGDGLKERAEQLGLAITSVGIRDVILPGEMKELMNRVTEAKKAAEANLIARREETAAMRSQANTARLLAENPTLMRLREL
ncbi:MAG: slipin family protein, partial [Planctomycetaceae bacterium]